MVFITMLYRSIIFKPAALTLILVMSFTIPALDFAQQSSVQKLKEGIQLFEKGDLDNAISVLRSCARNSDLNKEQQSKALICLAQAFLAKEYYNQAREAIAELLKIVPNYKTDPIQDRPQFIRLVEEVKQEQKTEETTRRPVAVRKSSEKWLWIRGGAVLAVGITAAILLGRGRKEETTTPSSSLPYPPTLPEK